MRFWTPSCGHCPIKKPAPELPELRGAIREFLEAWNKEPRPFVWTATVESITVKLSRCRQTLEQIQPGCTLPRTRKRKN